MFTKILIALVLVVAIVGGLVYTKIGQFSAMGKAAEQAVMPPETVTATAVQSMQWEQLIPSTGTVSPVQGVTVSAETGGRVVSIGFEPGAMVQQDAVLITLDADSERAQLASAEAMAALSRATLARRRELAKRALVSPADVDTAAAQAKEAQAQVGVVQALLDRKEVRAPFAGRLGLRQVNIGQILSVGDPIVSLQTMDPIHVDFSVPQNRLPEIATGMAVRLGSDAAQGSFEGRIIAISPEVDPVTRSVRVQAQVANPDEKLRAGMFAQVQVIRPESRDVLAIPASAVSYAPFGDSVFVVKDGRHEKTGEPERKLEQRFVQLGESRGDFVAVREGLAAGEVIATSGVFKLRSGMAVVIDNALAPQPSLAPRPPQS